MKKIRCDSNPSDFLVVSVSCGYAYIDTQQGDESTEIELSPEKIRKLRKQLKRVLLRIEGEKSDYKPGDSVYLAEGDGEGDDYCESPSVCNINLSRPVKLIKGLGSGEWKVEYETCNGEICVGYAYEKSFGRRA